MQRNMQTCIAGLLALVVISLATGCSDDLDAFTPESITGTIVVNPLPNAIAAPWEISGPRDESGLGNQTLSEMPVGDYTVAWGMVSGFVSPASTTRTLTADSTVTFRGSYLEEAGTVVIDQAPDALVGAGWAFSGPRSATGAGDTTFTEMPVGEYSIVWTPVSGYGTPADTAQTLLTDGTLTFAGMYTNDSIPPENFVTIPAGTFTMGSPEDEIGRSSDEAGHSVTLTTPFLMLATELTNRQYVELAQWAYDNGYCTVTSSSLLDNLDGSTRELLNLDSANCQISFSGGAFTVDAYKWSSPVVEVTWWGAVACCDWLSLREGLPRAYNHDTGQCNDHAPYSAQGYRLPTEAEWEYACRAGTQTPFNTGDCLAAGGEANYNGNLPYPGCPRGPYSGYSEPVRSYPANGWGLYEMHGNPWEWCNDFPGEYGGSETNPVGGDPIRFGGGYRALRGGRWDYDASTCRSANRGAYAPTFSSSYVTFRPVRSMNR